MSDILCVTNRGLCSGDFLARVEKLAAAGIAMDAFDALSLAGQAGSPKAVNLVLLGRFSRALDFTVEEWLSAIRESVPEKYRAMNERAFLLGRGA